MANPSNDEILNLLYCIAPQFKNPSADELECYNNIITVLQCQVNSGILSCCTTLAYVYLLAHMLTLQTNSNLGVISSMSEGSLSISFSVSVDSSILDSTPYGKAYLDLVKRKVFAPFVTNLPTNFNPVVYNGSCGC